MIVTFFPIVTIPPRMGLSLTHSGKGVGSPASSLVGGPSPAWSSATRNQAHPYLSYMCQLTETSLQTCVRRRARDPQSEVSCPLP